MADGLNEQGSTRADVGPRIAYRTFGCKANQYDTERIRQELEARGSATSGNAALADLVVLNTCTVTNQADADARRYIRRARRENPRLQLIVVGCSAALRPEAYRQMSGVKAVVEGHDPLEIVAQVEEISPRLVQIGARTTLERMDQEPVGGEVLLRRDGATRGWLKIQDGCDRRCSFCATRLARGRSRSRAPNEVVREAQALSRYHPELVITGIHIGHYGRDLHPTSTLSELVSELLEEVPGVRFRLGSIEATEVDDSLVTLLAESDGLVAPHLHMPLQSGADPVLRRMRRWHTRESYRTRVLEIADRVGVLGLGADIITGFPGETSFDHESTVALVEELPYTYLHVFPFSPREGTEAAEDHKQSPVPQRIAGERSRELRDLAERKRRSHRRGREGAAATVVLEGEGKTALTGDYLRVRTLVDESPDAACDLGEAPPDRPRSASLQQGKLRWVGGDLAIDLTRSARFN